MVAERASMTTAEERLEEIRAALAFRIALQIEEERISLRTAARGIGCDVSALFRLLRKPDYCRRGDAKIMQMQKALVWLGLTWGDLEPPCDRPTVLADVSQAIMELDEPEAVRTGLRMITEAAWRAMKGCTSNGAALKLSAPSRRSEGR